MDGRRCDMQIIGYGEDALTLWAITNKLGVILRKLGDDTEPSACKVFYRPSFGRRGGESRAEFGEFDFIILARDLLYLGESKWDRSSEEIKKGVLKLRAEQTRRYEVFKFYIDHWAYGDYSIWAEFVEKTQPLISKRLAPAGSLLASNLQTVLGAIRERWPSKPTVKDVLLYFHGGVSDQPIPQRVGGDFALVPLDYSEVALDHFVSTENVNHLTG
jgi:hypothetical protein